MFSLSTLTLAEAGKAHRFKFEDLSRLWQRFYEGFEKDHRESMRCTCSRPRRQEQRTRRWCPGFSSLTSTCRHDGLEDVNGLPGA